MCLMCDVIGENGAYEHIFAHMAVERETNRLVRIHYSTSFRAAIFVNWIKY